MEGPGETNQNLKSLNNATGVIHGDWSRQHPAGYDDLRTSCNNGVGLHVSAFGESFHLPPPSKQVNLNPQECGPLGLSLRKSISLVNLIETTLTQEHEQKIRRQEFYSQPSSKKLKASNFPAIFLEIGTWKWVSKNVGDLVAKLYYAKKKLVWEFLFGSLKKKMEISWCQISAINAFIREGENGRLEMELNEPPQFGQEINYRPGKHTQWTTKADFTGDQARICRRMKVEFLPGVLDKHFDNLLQCDNRLRHLSQQPFPIHNSPYFHNTYLNFSNSQSVVGCSSVPVANCHQQVVQHHLHVPPIDPFVGHSGSNLPSSASINARISQENKKTGGVLEQSGNFQIQGTSSILIGEQQDHLLPYHGPESMILNPELELDIANIQNLVEFSEEQQAEGNYDQITTSDNGGNGLNQVGYIDNEIALQEPSFWLPGEVVIDDTNTNSSVMNHMGYVDDGTCSVYQREINGGVALQEPISWLPDARVNTNYHVNPLDPIMEDYACTLYRNQNYKP